MELLSNLLIEDTHIQKLVKELESGKDQQLITGLSGSARAVFTKLLYNSLEKSILIVTPNLLHAQKLTEDLVKLVGEDLVRLYPADELIAADISITSPELRAQRLEALDHMLTKKMVFTLSRLQVLRNICRVWRIGKRVQSPLQRATKSYWKRFCKAL